MCKIQCFNLYNELITYDGAEALEYEEFNKLSPAQVADILHDIADERLSQSDTADGHRIGAIMRDLSRPHPTWDILYSAAKQLVWEQSHEC